jgi:hypothetical protein
MAKKKTKKEIIESDLDQEVAAEVAQTTETNATPASEESVRAQSRESSNPIERAAQSPEAEPRSAEPEPILHFFGREILEARFPQSVKTFDALVRDWNAGGEFEHLPISDPRVKGLVQEGLQRARRIERDVREVVETRVAPRALRAFDDVRKIYEQVAAARRRH